jgi:CRISPR/Cas system-associated protein Cas10 (large subunit of type III CRISPR-Cas system)
MTDSDTVLVDDVVRDLRYCSECERKTLNTNKARDSDDGKVRCQWCGEHNEAGSDE